MNILNKLIKRLKKNWCVVDLAEFGGGYVGQQYLTEPAQKPTQQPFDQLEYLLKKATKGSRYISTHSIRKWFYSKNAAIKYAIKLSSTQYISVFRGDHYFQVAGIYAVCNLQDPETDPDTLCVSDLYASRKNGRHVGVVYSVTNVSDGLSVSGLVANNLWIFWSDAEKYKKTLGNLDNFAIRQI